MEDAKRYVDLLIVIPLQEEADVLFQVLKPLKSSPHDNLMFTEMEVPGSDLTLVAVQCTDAGCNEARLACEVAFKHFDVGVVACVGIAGRISGDLKLGDVCYTGVVLDVSEKQKIVDIAGTRGMDILFSPETFQTPLELHTSVTFSRTDREQRKKLFEGWQEECGSSLDAVLRKLNADEKTREKFREFPECNQGKIACGPVSASKNFIRRLIDHDRKILAIETESGGIFKASDAHRRTPTITIRGISDFADDKKNKLEGETKGAARYVAAYNASAFLKIQLQNPYFLDYLRFRKHELTGKASGDLFVPEKDKRESIAAILAALAARTDSVLRDLSPEYRVQPAGYVLPSPRLSPFKTPGDPRNEEDADYYEVHEVLAQDRVVLVDVPLNYPDEGLPWVLARALAGAVINGKLAIPFVLDGKRVVAPHDLEELLPDGDDLPSLEANESVQVVLIVHGFDLRSRSRATFLLKQIDKYPAVKFLFASRGEGTLVSSLETVQRLAAKPYRVDAVPFLAIANFVAKNFHFEPLQAEVIAYRIQNAFARFDLLAHPSYFAGIPEDTLIALLQANRRSELIQLAVDGFLTFMVAEDKSLPLSRTTRRRFLSELAVELEVFKRVFSTEKLVEFGEAFFSRYDFEGDVKLFVDRFFQKGILRLEDGAVQFSLPFIKKYLLATALAKDEKLAKTYFAFGADDFDVETFDLYAELGANDDIVSELLARLTSNLEELSKNNGASGILLTGEAKPVVLDRPGQIEALRKGVQQSLRTLAQHHGDGNRKQKFIDVANQAAKETGRAKDNGSGARTEIDLSSNARRDWQVGCVLLGAAAEQLVASQKLQLIALLIATASRLIDIQTRAVASVDYRTVKERILHSPDTVEFLAGFDSEQERDLFTKVTGNLLDLMELAMYAQPFVSTMNFLTEQARHQILVASIEKVDTESLQEEIVKNSWLADLDVSRGRGPLRASVKKLPAAPFFRIVLATHIWRRVYWVQWREEDRLALIETAHETVSPLGMSFSEEAVLRRKLRQQTKERDEEDEE